jgi:hypothetical protein
MGCVYVKDWFKPIFRPFLTLFLSKLKLLTPMVEPPPPSVISHVTPMI